VARESFAAPTIPGLHDPHGTRGVAAHRCYARGMAVNRRAAHHPLIDGEATTLGQQILAAIDRAELLANPTRHLLRCATVMPGSGRLGGRGVSVGTGSIPALVAGRPLVVPSRIAAVVAAQLFDFATFTIMVSRHGIGTELNPLVAHGFAGFGMPMVAVMKIALVLLLGSIIVVLDRPGHVDRRLPWIAPVIAVLAVVAGLVGGLSNTIAT
jgi:hypothetical protein